MKAERLMPNRWHIDESLRVHGYLTARWQIWSLRLRVCCPEADSTASYS